METLNSKSYLIPASIVLSAVIVGLGWTYSEGLKAGPNGNSAESGRGAEIAFEEKVLPPDGIELPVVWGDLGKQMAESGVIDKEKLEAIYKNRGGLSEEEKMLLYGSNNGKLKMNYENSGFLLNLFWALGLGNKNAVLENGPMMDSRYGGAGRFASTGGWSIARGDAMGHYSAHQFFKLTTEQQAMVERVSKGIYRPCCNNPTYFPDCNHGMAMLGLLELMAAQGVSEADMYKIALQVNSYWFPDTYLTIAKYFAQKNIDWSEVDPRQVLGADFSSASGYQNILAQVEPVEAGSGGGCGI